MHRLTPLLLAVFCLPSATAAARAAPQVPVSMSPLFVRGSALAHDMRVDIRCEEAGGNATPGARSAFCDVVASFRLVAREPISIRANPSQATIDGARVDERELEAGADVLIELRVRVHVSTEEDQSFRWIVEPAEMRHVLLGEHRMAPVPGFDAVVLLSSDQVQIQDAVHVGVTAPDFITVTLGEHAVRPPGADVPADRAMVTFRIEPIEVDRLIDHGGPVLSGGVRLRQGTVNPFLRGAYELAIAGYFLASIAFETDFDSIMESIVIEVASPLLMYLLPSFSVGVGLVARQLGDRDADAALRLRVGANHYAVGVSADMDYWPVTGEWTGTMVGRISL